MKWMNGRRAQCALVVGVMVLQGAMAMAAFEWEKASPESRGMDAAKIDALVKNLESKGTVGLLIIRNDRVVCEWYAPQRTAAQKHSAASLSKALVGGTALLLAMDEGLISADDLASKYIPAWKSDPLKAKITIRQLATHTSGVSDAEEEGVSHKNLTGWKGDFWNRTASNPFAISIAQAPVLFEPGTDNQYSNPGIACLGYAVTAAIQGTPEKDLRSLLKAKLMDPIGVAPEEWSIGYGLTDEVEGLKLVATWGGGSLSPRAVARVGRFMLRKGNWEGRELVQSASVEHATADAGMPVDRKKGDLNPRSGLAWYNNSDGIWANLPRDAFAGAGAGHQVLLVVPSLDLIVVRMGAKMDAGEKFWTPIYQNVFAPVAASINQASASDLAKAPYPPSPVIAQVDWAPAESIIRKAPDSDVWPMTWADDDNQYTAYGDGRGFEPRVKEKLSMGLARVEGPADAFAAVNIRSADAEAKGDGKSGAKPSGMLMVDGTLYMLVRNKANAQLAWSTDHGQSWQWADWKFTTSFGCPSFLNYGRDYAGARDAYVYVYSFDNDSAYVLADRMVMARVPKDRIADREAWEFFQQLDAGGKPVWTADIAQRGAVFEHKGHCYRGGVSYNAGLKRYLWCQNITGGPLSRFKGGLGIYDAPEPWGPWTTVFYTEQWDVGPGDTANFPTKWMSGDGLTVHMVFSGADAFSVRRAELKLRGPAQ